MIACIGNCQLNAHLLYARCGGRWNAGVGNDMVDVFHIGNFAEAAPSELGGVRKYDCLLGGLHHDAVETCFHHVGGGDAEIKVDAVYADEQLAA